MCTAAALQNRSTSAVAEEDASVSIFPIDDGRKFFRADDQDGVVSVRSNELLRDFECVDESGACGFDIERSRASRANFLLNKARSGRKEHVRGDRRDDD